MPEAGYAVAFPDDWVVEVGRVMCAAALSAEAPDGGSCEVTQQDGSRWSSLDDAAEFFVSVLRDFGAAPTSTALRLPVGDAIRIDMELPDTGSSGVVYLLTDGTDPYSLMCRAPDPPEDRWLSIAETFEFLPVEED